MVSGSGLDAAVGNLAAAVRGVVRTEADLGALTTLRVGGPGRVLVEVDGDDDLAAVGGFARRHGLPWTVVGRGSNLLVSDDGWPGLVIVLGRAFRGVEINGDLVTVGAAEPLPSLARALADAGLTGLAWAGGVPGAVGGAVRMNAGAHGGELADVLVEVDLFRLRSGVRETWPASLLGLSYRHSELPDDAVVVAATLRLEPGDAAAERDEIARVRAWRREHQPINQPNCGSVFTNPPGDSAGRLLDLAGGKRLREGGAQVSELHANFIVTRPGATATDVHRLIRRMRALVLQAHGVALRPEVTTLGRFPAWDAPVEPEGAAGGPEPLEP